MAGRYRLTLRNRHFFVLDVAIFMVTAWFSFVIRLETFKLMPAVWQAIALFLVFVLPIKFSVFILSGMYTRYWKNAGPSDLLVTATACLVSGMVSVLVFLGLSGVKPIDVVNVPRTVPLIDFLLTLVLVVTSRFSLRAYTHANLSWLNRKRRATRANSFALIIGAGQTGLQVLDALNRDASAISPIGFLDDDVDKAETFVRGLKVLGKVDDLRRVVQQYGVELVIVAIPSAPGSVIRQIVKDCQSLGVEYKQIPDVYELVTGRITVDTLRPVKIDDLLRRRPVSLQVEDIDRQIRGNCVLVTGAGGSIGSEIARQIAKHDPKLLVLVGHGENSLFLTESKLKREFPGLNYIMTLADVKDFNRMDAIFARYRPSVVYHAAAYKHVPMLEANMCEGVLNNVRGPSNMVELCNRYEVQRMVLISSDKAVNPTNIMGMTKRVGEMIMMSQTVEHSGRFAAVRFGNVLGSRGSVVPIFQQQIAQGGPITITSDKMTRFFMSIPEAASLVLKAGVLLQYGPLFVLNMGEPVKIRDLAEDLIRLSGLVPDRDIEIRETGIRPGEKLHEELFWEYEKYEAVESETLFALQLSTDQLRVIRAQVGEKVTELIDAAKSYDEANVRRLLNEIVFSLSALNNKRAEIPQKTDDPQVIVLRPHPGEA